MVCVSAPRGARVGCLHGTLTTKGRILYRGSVALGSSRLSRTVSLTRGGRIILTRTVAVFRVPVCGTLLRGMGSNSLNRLGLVRVGFNDCGRCGVGGQFFGHGLTNNTVLSVNICTLSFIHVFVDSYPGSILSRIGCTRANISRRTDVLLGGGRRRVTAIVLSLRTGRPGHNAVSFSGNCIRVFRCPENVRTGVACATSNRYRAVSTNRAGSTLLCRIRSVRGTVRNSATLVRLSCAGSIVGVVASVHGD